LPHIPLPYDIALIEGALMSDENPKQALAFIIKK
jgi:hypothetical protein